jgi:hypothetical protein
MHKQTNKEKIINTITQTKANKINKTTSGHKIPTTIRENAPAFAPTNFQSQKKKKKNLSVQSILFKIQLSSCNSV